jgi:uncharacterized membrane protein
MSTSNNTQENTEETTDSNYTHIFGSHKISIILLLVFVIFVYIIMFSILHKNNETPPGWIMVIEIILWITLIIIIIVNIKWLNDKDFNIKTEINDLFDDKLTNLNIFAMDNSYHEDKIKDSKTKDIQTKDIQTKDVQTKDLQKRDDISCNNIEDGEVFHVQSNDYSYDDAKGVCELLGSRLATYEEVERAYQNGANWCNYGWSDEQLALFPIQKSLYNELKTIPGHKHDCGRQGVNGGYIEDSTTKFGVNCYGKKPYMTDNDAEFMKNYTYTPTMSPEDQSKINDAVNNILIAPFSKDKWNFK